jgi:hypothetical protein
MAAPPPTKQREEGLDGKILQAGRQAGANTMPIDGQIKRFIQNSHAGLFSHIPEMPVTQSSGATIGEFSRAILDPDQEARTRHDFSNGFLAAIDLG